MSVPNILTLFRLASAPLFLVVFIGSGPDRFLSSYLSPTAGILACIVIAALSELSDVLDGIIARRFNQVSNFGKVLDPYADSTFRLSVFFSFASQAHGMWVPLWMVMILFYRDLLVTVIRNFGIERGVFVQARASGKIKAICQGTCAITVMVIAFLKGDAHVQYSPESGEPGMAHHLMWVVTAVTLWSAFDYFWGNKHLFKEPEKKSPAAPAEAQVRR